MNKKALWLIVVVVIIMIIIVGLATSRSSESIRIGLVAPLTGPAASTGELLKQGLEWKIAELNAAGQKIDLVVEDTLSDPKQAVSSFNKLVDIEGIKIIFTVSSAAGMNLKPLAESKHVLLWGDITHPSFTASTSYVLRHSNIVDFDTKINADHILSKNIGKVGIIYQQDDFGNAFNEYLTKYLTEKGVTVRSEGVDAKSSDFRTPITKINSSNPGAIVAAIVGPGSGLIAKQTKELGYKGSMYQSVGFILTPTAPQLAGDAAKGMFYLTYEDNQTFTDEYRKQFGKDPSLLAQIGYTDMEILMDAITKTKSTNPEKLIAYIKSLGSFQGRFERITITPQGDIVIPTIIKVWE